MAKATKKPKGTKVYEVKCPWCRFVNRLGDIALSTKRNHRCLGCYHEYTFRIDSQGNLHPKMAGSPRGSILEEPPSQSPLPPSPDFARFDRTATRIADALDRIAGTVETIRVEITRMRVYLASTERKKRT